jgi:hypothetical protein
LGLALDAERKKIGPGMAAQLGETQPQLTRLLQTSGEKPIVSRIDFQKNAPNVNTCGRWTGLRLRNKNMTDPDFAAYVHAGVSSSGLSPDAWVDKETGGSGY